MLDRVGFIGSPNPVEGSFELRAGEKKENLKLKLTPTGTIVGRVLDADGQPMENITVAVEIGGRTFRSATTDDRGIYRLGGLRPGTVRVKARPVSMPFPPEIRTDGTVEVHYSPTYHPSALDAKSATRVEVGPATEVSGIDIRMIRTPIRRVAGKLTGIPPGAENIFVSLQPQGSGARAKADGVFEIWRVDPGKYWVAAAANMAGKQYASAPVVVEMMQSDVENLTLDLLPVGDLAGQVIYEDEDAAPRPPSPSAAEAQGSSKPAGAPKRRVVLTGVQGLNSNSTNDMQEDGSFTLQHVSPGKYRVQVTPGGIYVKSITLGPANFDGGTLDLSAGATAAPLVLHVASARGAVNGVVRDEKGPVRDVRVVIAEQSAERGLTQQTRSKEDGSYSLAGLAPGKYRLFLAEDNEMSQIQLSLEQYDDVAEKIEITDREIVVKDLKRK
jgi:hypothetical protein